MRQVMVRFRKQLSSGRSLKFYDAERDDRGWTLLHIGARKGDLKEMTYESFGDVPLDQMIAQLITLNLLRCYSDWSLPGLFLLSKVKRLLDEGMDVNVPAWGPKSPGVTPLHLAAEGGHLKVMDELLERGADIDARTKGACGWTPLHNAAKERNKNAIKFLVENGAFLPDDINDSRFNPPLHYCLGLEWAYDIKRVQEETSSSSLDGSCSSEP